MDKIIEVPGVGNVSFPDSMSDDDISSAIRQSVATRQSSAPQVSVGPRSGNSVSNYLEDLKGDIQYDGNPRTFLGKILRGAGFHPTGTDTVSNIMTGPVTGPLTAAHGVATIPQSPVRGINETLRGIGQTVAIPAAVVNPAFIAEAAPYAAAGAGAQAVSNAAGASPDTSELIGNIAGMGANPAMRGARGFARFLQSNPEITNKVFGTAGGLIALNQLLHGSLRGAIADAAITYGAKAAIPEVANADIPNPLSGLSDVLRQRANSQPKTSNIDALNILRQRLALPPAPKQPITLNASSLDATQTAPEGLLPAARQVVRDTNTGQLRDQYTTSVASPNQSPYSIVGAKNLKTPTAIDDLQGYKMNSAIEQVRDLMSRQDGVGAAETDARMAEYAKKPWENEKTSVTVPEKVTVGTKAGADNDTALFQNARKILGPNASISDVAQLAQKMKTGIAPASAGQNPIPQEAAQYMPEVVNNSSDLLGLLQKSLAAARARK